MLCRARLAGLRVNSGEVIVSDSVSVCFSSLSKMTSLPVTDLRGQVCASVSKYLCVCHDRQPGGVKPVILVTGAPQSLSPSRRDTLTARTTRTEGVLRGGNMGEGRGGLSYTRLGKEEERGCLLWISHLSISALCFHETLPPSRPTSRRLCTRPLKRCCGLTQTVFVCMHM